MLGESKPAPAASSLWADGRRNDDGGRGRGIDSRDTGGISCVYASRRKHAAAKPGEDNLGPCSGARTRPPNHAQAQRICAGGKPADKRKDGDNRARSRGASV